MLPPSVAERSHAVEQIGLRRSPRTVAGVTPQVGTKNQTRCRLLAEPGHGQRFNHDIRRHSRRDRPADNYQDFALPLEPDVLCPQSGQFHLLRSNPLGAPAAELAGIGRFPPLVQRLFDQARLPRHGSNALTRPRPPYRQFF